MYIFLSRCKEHTGIGPAISGGDFPQHQCAGQSPAAPLIPTGDANTPPPSVEVTANKPLTSRKDENKQQQVATSSGPAEFDLQGLIDSEIEEVRFSVKTSKMPEHSGIPRITLVKMEIKGWAEIYLIYHIITINVIVFVSWAHLGKIRKR